ncbi:MAG: hypothetical protein KBT06_09540 [Prevotellaceae bacterium]|nr:hypothetical protein [Candidatus Colivivens equi]
MDIEDRINVCQEPQELLALIAECHDIDTLFKVWKVYNEKKPLRNKIDGKMVSEKSAFISDGVLCLPEDRHDKWWLEPSYPKVLFILKDQYQKNDRWDEDIRNWLVWSDEKNPHRGEDIRTLKSIKKGNKNIFRPLGRLLMGVHAILENDSYIAFEELSDEVVADYISNNPMAIFESKKQPGGAILDRKVLKEYLVRDRDFIKREIELLDPNVIICCDKCGIIYAEIVSILGGECHNPNITKVCNHTYVINSYHPSYSYRGYELECYNYVINALWEYLHPYQEKKQLQMISPTIHTTPKILCDRVKELTQSPDWSIYKDSVNFQKRIIQYEVEPRIGIEAIFENDNCFRIYLAFWRGSDKWKKNPQMAITVKHYLDNLRGEIGKWGAKGDYQDMEKKIGKPGAFLYEIDTTKESTEDIALELKKWYDILLKWLNECNLIDS